MNLCLCGCKQEVTKEGNKYINGHNQKNKEPWNKGILNCFSEETKRKQSEAKKGKKRSPLSKETKRKISESRIGKYCGENHPLFGKTTSEETRRKQSEANKGKPKSEETKRKMSEVKIGKKLPPHSEETKRKISESKIGKLNPNYKGGISCEPYCPDFSNKGWRQIIYIRDRNACQNCGITKILSYKIFGHNLHIHHIDYDKKNCGRNNCLLLCNRCNTKSNNHRWMWELIYKDKLGVFN